MKSEIALMQRSFWLAEKGKGKTSPNPMVGAVIVKNGEIVGEGYHQGFGLPHAEIEALKMAGERAHDSDLYINLEPCCHYGKTPPCTKAITAAGIKKVIVSVLDPNPQVNGKGIGELKEAGIFAEVGILEKQGRQLNEVFFKWMTQSLPFTILKAAITLDGKTAAGGGDSKWITGEKARAKAREMRGWYDAVLVGINTVLKDDPLLTCRTSEFKNPIRIVLDSYLRISEDSALMKSLKEAPVWIATGSGDDEKIKKIEASGADVVRLPMKEGRIDLAALYQFLSSRQISSLFVEGGSKVFGAFLREKRIDKILLFMAPKLLGGAGGKGMIEGWGADSLSAAVKLKDWEVSSIDMDLLIQGYPEFSIS
jgi:diaminohydroxyphosphoribosylaminopyrimidine deaminase/5-amino-6-(5-phosphoribosylamino)uracil reductase